VWYVTTRWLLQPVYFYRYFVSCLECRCFFCQMAEGKEITTSLTSTFVQYLLYCSAAEICAGCVSYVLISSMFWNVTSRLYWKELSTTGRGLVGAGFPYCKVCTPGTLRSSSKKFRKSCSSSSVISSFNQKYTLCKMVPFAMVLADVVPSSTEEVQDVSNVPVKPAAVTDFKKFLLSIAIVFGKLRIYILLSICLKFISTEIDEITRYNVYFGS